MPYLSVCVPTMRVGGLDVLFSGLAGQEFRDFELVLADGVPRPHLSTERSFGFPVRRVVPDPNPFPVNSFCKYANAALDASSGEVVVFVTDYTWLPPDCLRRHAEFHRARPGEGYMAPHDYVVCPPLHPEFPRYEPGILKPGFDPSRDTERYAGDVLSGRLDAFGFSVFAERFSGDPRSMPRCPNQAGDDPKLKLPAGPVGRSMFHGKNESVPGDVARRVRWNEELDGTHGWQDSDMADALGLQWTLDPSNVALIVNPRSHFPFARRTRDMWENEAIWKRGRR